MTNLDRSPTTHQRGGRSSGTQAIDRSLAVLSSFVQHSEQGISDIASNLAISPSTVHRIVQALVAAGYLVQDAETDRYRLGHAAVVLGQSARESFGLERALPILRRLGGETGESVNLGVRDGAEVVVVMRVQSVQPLRFDQPAGTRISLHCSSMGKSLLAFGDPDLSEITFTPVTSHTLTTAAVLAESLEQTRKLGYSTDVEESIMGVSCVGAPILDSGGRAIAAIAVQGPTVRMTVERQAHLGPRIVAAANEIGLAMGLDL